MLVSICQRILNQLSTLIHQLDADLYARPLPIFNGSSIGGHTRHIIEFFDCLLVGIPDGVVNYDDRKRDLQIQTNRDYALEVLRRTHASIECFDRPDGPLALDARYGTLLIRNATSIDRELAYMIEHAIHHFALIRIGVQTEAPEVRIEPDFGVAFSTIEHRTRRAHQPASSLPCAS
jgi:hypothetical protein